MRNRTNGLRRLALAMIVMALIASGCGDDDPAPAAESTPDTTPAVMTDSEEASTDDGDETQLQEESTTPDDDTLTATTAPTTSEAPADPVEADLEEPSREPLRLGAISTLTGPASFPESHLAAQAVFDRVNAAGGIGGRMIEYSVEDDGFDPGLASQAARRLADEVGVVAMVGSASILECAVNAGYYAETGLYSIQGTGIDPVCFATSNISPVNTGPFFSDAVALYYASEELAAENVCFGAFDVPDFQPAYAAAVAEWTAATGKELTYSDTTLIFDGDLTPFMLELESNGCDAAASCRPTTSTMWP